MLELPASMPVREALAAYIHNSGLSPDGGYAARWIRLRTGALPLYIPNLGRRKKTLELHDLHHLATGYDTSWRGEAEIAAWELGAGCAHHLAAWAIDIISVAYGLVLIPQRVLRAFRRGRRCSSLFHGSAPGDVLDLPLGELRRRLGLDASS